MAEKKPFINKEHLEEIVAQFPTPFHLYDEAGIVVKHVPYTKLLLGIKVLKNILLLKLPESVLTENSS